MHRQGPAPHSPSPLQTKPGWKGPALQTIHPLTLAPTGDSTAPVQSGQPGSSPRASPRGSSQSLFLHPHPPGSSLPFLLVPAPQAGPVSQTSAFSKHPPGAPGSHRPPAAPARSACRLRVGKMEGRKQLGEIGGKAFLLRFTEKLFAFSLQFCGGKANDLVLSLTHSWSN